MSVGEAPVPKLGDVLAELSARVDRIDAAGRLSAQALAECVMRLAKAVEALQDQVTMIREAAGLSPDRRDS